MPRKPRFSPGGIAYHVMTRTWGNIILFEDAEDYAAFERVLAEAVDRHPSIRLCSYCLMPNHFHFAVWPAEDGQLSRFMQWLTPFSLSSEKGVISLFCSCLDGHGEMA